MSTQTLIIAQSTDPSWIPYGQEKKKPVVPEPSTYVQVGVMLLVIGAIALHRRFRSR